MNEGKGLGRTIENAFYKIVLQEKSGVIYEIVEKTTKIQLEHKLETNGAIHWNPDVYAPPHAWYHSSDWYEPGSDGGRGAGLLLAQSQGAACPSPRASTSGCAIISTPDRPWSWSSR